jgi:hypothetical protein
MKITKHQRKKFKNTSEDGRFSQVQGMAEFIL